jgi:hypothetical protein
MRSLDITGTSRISEVCNFHFTERWPDYARPTSVTGLMFLASWKDRWQSFLFAGSYLVLRHQILRIWIWDAMVMMVVVMMIIIIICDLHWFTLYTYLHDPFQKSCPITGAPRRKTLSRLEEELPGALLRISNPQTDRTVMNEKKLILL